MSEKRKCKKCGDTKPLKQFRESKGYKEHTCKSCAGKLTNNRAKSLTKHVQNNLLIIPDTHAPYHHEDAIAFLEAVKERYKPKQVIHLGDEVDQHAMSFHDSDPDLPSAGEELVKARLFIAELASLFPDMQICDSNHGSLVHRRAKAHGIPRDAIVPYREYLRAPDGWEWGFEFEHQGVLFAHGDGKTGNIESAMKEEMMSVAFGHHHSKFSIVYKHTRNGVYFGMNCGCLIDQHSPAFSYAKKGSKRPALGCGLLINGQPMLIRMILDANNRWTGEL